MKKSLLAILLASVFILLSCDASALPRKKKKKTAFTQGQSALQLGAGFPSLLKPAVDSFMYFGEVTRNGFPPIQLRYEYAVTGNIGVGAMFGYASSKVTITDNTDSENINGFKYTYILLGARAAFHLPNKSAKFDPYVVGFAGLNLTTASPFGPSNPLETQKKIFSWSAHAGANYYFVGPLGGFLEVGYGISYVNAGVTFKFGS